MMLCCVVQITSEVPTHYDLLDFKGMWSKKNSGRLTNKAWRKRSDPDLYIEEPEEIPAAYYVKRNSGRLTNKAWKKRSDQDLYIEEPEEIPAAYYARRFLVKRNSGRLTNKAWKKRSNTDVFIEEPENSKSLSWQIVI